MNHYGSITGFARHYTRKNINFFHWQMDGNKRNLKLKKTVFFALSLVMFIRIFSTEIFQSHYMLLQLPLPSPPLPLLIRSHTQKFMNCEWDTHSYIYFFATAAATTSFTRFIYSNDDDERYVRYMYVIDFHTKEKEEEEEEKIWKHSDKIRCDEFRTKPYRRSFDMSIKCAYNAVAFARIYFGMVVHTYVSNVDVDTYSSCLEIWFLPYVYMHHIFALFAFYWIFTKTTSCVICLRIHKPIQTHKTHVCIVLMACHFYALFAHVYFNISFRFCAHWFIILVDCLLLPS